MKKHLRAFLAGLVLVAPFAVTFYVIWSLALWLGGIGLGIYDFYGSVPPGQVGKLPHDFLNTWATFGIAVAGAAVMLAAIYLAGLYTRTLLMGRMIRMAERLIAHVPGVKTIYESIRDLLKLFGSDSKKMGKVVLYRPSGGEVAMLGVMTNQNPSGLAGIPDHQLVAIYLPLAFMLGGQILYVPRKYLTELDLPVEQALKICATAETGLQNALATDTTLPSPPKTKKKK